MKEKKLATLTQSLNKTEVVEMESRKATNTSNGLSHVFGNIPAFYRTYEAILP